MTEAENPLSALTRARAQLGNNFKAAHREYRPPLVADRLGGDLDDDTVLERVLPAAAAGGELMLLCMGHDGSKRQAANLVLSFRAMGLYHMLTMAPDEATCEALWLTIPSLACVWWPSQFARPRPKSLYNDMFSRTALAFFEARKILLERLVVAHELNVLHLDGDTSACNAATCWRSNPQNPQRHPPNPRRKFSADGSAAPPCAPPSPPAFV